MRSASIRKLIWLFAWCGGFEAAHAGILLRSNSEPGPTWPALSGYSNTVGGSVTATPTINNAGTIDTSGTNTSSNGLRLLVNSGELHCFLRLRVTAP